MYTTMNQLKQLIYFNDMFIIDYMLLYFEFNSWNNILIKILNIITNEESKLILNLCLLCKNTINDLMIV